MDAEMARLLDLANRAQFHGAPWLARYYMTRLQQIAEAQA